MSSLKNLMEKSPYPLKAFARALEISPSGLKNRIYGPQRFSAAELKAIAKLLGLDLGGLMRKLLED